MKQFRVWVNGCSHVGNDLKHGRESLAEAIHQSEFGGADGGPPFEWDIALSLGDFSGNQRPADDEEGREVARQLSAGKTHRRELIYTLAGNHDATGPDDPSPQWWFRKWIDPTGENTEYSHVRASEMPYPVDGTWERYSFRVGNLVFLMMSDRNDGGPPVGRGAVGGYPAGAVTSDTFEWWKRQIEGANGAIVISAHHYVLKETTVASGPFEGFRPDGKGGWKRHYHNYLPDGAPEGASYLYFVDDQPDDRRFVQYLERQPGATSMWLAAHTHTNPDDRYGGRSHIEERWGCTFVNAAALTAYHVRATTVPMSRLLTFVDGSSEVTIRCYLHTSGYAKQGWYAPAERTITLPKPFSINPAPQPPR